MKTLLTIFTLVFTVMFASTSFAEWVKIGTNADQNTFYVKPGTIKRVNQEVYFWAMAEYLSDL